MIKRLVTPVAGVGLMLALASPAVSSAASNTKPTLFPVDEATQLETHNTATSPSAPICARPRPQ
jgi:hypothetical protein